MLKVAGIQMDIVWEKPVENYRTATQMAGQAVEAGARLVVLPEMFATGFSMDAEYVSAFSDETRGFLANLARHFGVHVLGGYAEPAEPKPRNACSVFDPEGREVLHYQKIHPFTLAKEHEHYSGGDTLETVAIEGVRVTPLICYDLRFPEPFREAAADTDLFVVIANWPERRRAAWIALLRARAIENQAYVLGVNRVGTAGDAPHTGDSGFIDPMAEQEVFVRDDPAVLLGEVDPDHVATLRRKLSFVADRRPEVYARLRVEK
jgi:predicted amidohydrolase